MSKEVDFDQRDVRRVSLARTVTCMLGAFVALACVGGACYLLAAGKADASIVRREKSDGLIEQRFASLRIGMTKRQVLDTLGPPKASAEKAGPVQADSAVGYLAGNVFKFFNGDFWPERWYYGSFRGRLPGDIIVAPKDAYTVCFNSDGTVAYMSRPKLNRL